MVICNSVHLFREAKFCGVPSCVLQIGCAAGEKCSRNTGLMNEKDIITIETLSLSLLNLVNYLTYMSQHKDVHNTNTIL
jgi:hypothetical protein